MKAKRIIAAIMTSVLAFGTVLHASAMTELTLSSVPHKFDIGSDENGGSGVEEDEESGRGQNWIKVIQPFNEANLTEEFADPDVAAVAVTFEISDWSGKEFNIGWGALITYYDESGNWYGFDDFKGISDYVINAEGEYTCVCDLGSLCIKENQPYGISYLQALEMVIDGVDEGDKTNIEVKSVRAYFNGEAIEDAVMPDGTRIPIETAALIVEGDESAANTSSDTQSQQDSSTEESTADSSTAESSSAADNSSVSDSSKAADDSSKKESESSTSITIALIAAGAAVLVAIIAVIIKKKK